jgi:hypothetical protein
LKERNLVKMQRRAGLRPRGGAPPVGRGPPGRQALNAAAQAQAAQAQVAALAAALAAANPPLPPLFPIPPVIPLPPVVPPPIPPVIPPPPAPVVPLLPGAGLAPAAIVPTAVIPPIPADPQGAFLHVLEHIVGMDTQVKRDSVTVTAGCVKADDLMYVETESLINCLDPATSIIAKTHLKTLKNWVEDSFDIHGIVDVAMFMADVCRESQRAIARTLKPSTTQAETSVTKEKLSVWNGRRETWQKSKKEITAYPNQIKNELGIPVYYVIRDPDLEQQYQTESGEIGRKIYEAPHTGCIYENDAFQVLQILRQWTSGGRAEPHVDNSNNVQDAWNSIIMAFEGHDAKGANIAKACQDLKDAHWMENKKNWSFDDYCSAV